MKIIISCTHETIQRNITRENKLNAANTMIKRATNKYCKVVTQILCGILCCCFCFATFFFLLLLQYFLLLSIEFLNEESVDLIRFWNNKFRFFLRFYTILTDYYINFSYYYR